MKAEMLCIFHRSSFNKKVKDAGKLEKKIRDAQTDEHARPPHAI